MQTVLNVDPDELRAAASRWQMIGSDLGTGGAPPVGLATSWPSAAATAGIHGQAAAATEAFQAKRHRYINLGVVAIMIAGVAFDWVRARRRRTKP